MLLKKERGVDGDRRHPKSQSASVSASVAETTFPELEGLPEPQRPWVEATRAFQRRLLLETLRRHRFQVAGVARWLWGGDKLIDGWLPFFILALVLAGLWRARGPAAGANFRRKT